MILKDLRLFQRSYPFLYHNQSQSNKNFQFSTFKPLSNSSLNHYQVLGINTGASLKEIKAKFKELSKKFHPDLNSHLSEDESKKNKDKYIKIINAYEILKSESKRKNYDSSLNIAKINDRSQFDKKYYGEAKYYSRSNLSSSQRGDYSPSGYNIKKNKIYYGPGTPYRGKSSFNGKPNEGSKFDVPHFDYETHLNKNLKFELRNLNKKFANLTSEERKNLDEYEQNQRQNLEYYKLNLDKHKYNKEQYLINLNRLNSYHGTKTPNGTGRVVLIFLSLIFSLLWYII